MISPEPQFIRDHFLYNSVWLLLLSILIMGRSQSDHISLISFIAAIFFWGIGSLLAGITEFDEGSSPSTFLSQICYALFYPFILLIFPRLISRKEKITTVEIVDTIIVGIGFASCSAILIHTTLFSSANIDRRDLFFLVFYPMGDVAILLAIFLLLFRIYINRQILTLLLGVISFTGADIYFLWQSIRGSYTFGNYVDDIWLVAVAIIGIGFSSIEHIEMKVSDFHPSFIALAIASSPLLLLLNVLKPDFLPNYIVIPLVLNILLSFFRMKRAMDEARQLSIERSLARTDELTGLPNRRRLISEIGKIDQWNGALLLLDLDGFKPVNDMYGHETGDYVLQEIARRFQRILSPTDLLARLGGDEFGALISGDADRTLEVAEALRATLSYPLRYKDLTLHLSVSIGHMHNDGQGRLLERADAAMYRAKRSGLGVLSGEHL